VKSNSRECASTFALPAGCGSLKPLEGRYWPTVWVPSAGCEYPQDSRLFFKSGSWNIFSGNPQAPPRNPQTLPGAAQGFPGGAQDPSNNPQGCVNNAQILPNNTRTLSDNARDFSDAAQTLSNNV